MPAPHKKRKMIPQTPYILLDFDGVISPGRYFSDIYAEQHGIDAQSMMPFFEHDKKQANIGNVDTKVLLAPYLQQWNWNKSVEAFMQYWFESDADIDNRIKEWAQSMRSNEHKIYLATDQEHYRADYIWNTQQLNTWLDGKFISHEIGFEKSSPEFFQHVITTLNAQPSSITLIDDSESKVQAAQQAGLHTIHYKSIASIE